MLSLRTSAHTGVAIPTDRGTVAYGQMGDSHGASPLGMTEHLYFLTFSIHTSLPPQTVARHLPLTFQPAKGVDLPMD